MASYRKLGRNWYYRYIDADGRQIERKGCPGRRETEAMAAAAELESAQIKAGLIDPKALGYRDHDARPLGEHLADWYAYLIGKGSTKAHADLSRSRAERLINLSRARRVSDLTPSRVQAALKTVRDEGLALRTVHHHVQVIKGFSRWLWRDGRSRENALAHMTAPNPDPDRRRVRRALTPDELARVVAAAERGPEILNLSGSDRAVLYRLAAGTGFRRGELASLVPERFDLDANPPIVTVQAAYSKRRRDDAQPIRRDLAEVLRPWLATKAPGKQVFGRLTTHTSRMMRRDLAAAGVPEIDASGRVADFHALRHSYVSALARSNAPVKVLQTLARHSTPTLTLNTYAHIGVFDQTAALEALPGQEPPPPAPGAAAMAATGTNSSHGHSFPLFFPYAAQGKVGNLTDADGSPDMGMEECGPRPMKREPLENKCSDGSGGVPTGREGWRECMGIGPTGGLSQGRPPVLKTGAGTSRASTPESARHRLTNRALRSTDS